MRLLRLLSSLLSLLVLSSCFVGCDQSQSLKRRLTGKWCLVEKTFKGKSAAEKEVTTHLPPYENWTIYREDGHYDHYFMKGMALVDTHGRYEVKTVHSFERMRLESANPTLIYGPKELVEVSFRADRMTTTIKAFNQNGEEVGTEDSVFVKCPPR